MKCTYIKKKKETKRVILNHGLVSFEDERAFFNVCTFY